MVDDIGADPRRVRRRDAGARRQDLFAALDLNGALDPKGSAHDMDNTAIASLRDARQAVADPRQRPTNDNAE